MNSASKEYQNVEHRLKPNAGPEHTLQAQNAEWGSKRQMHKVNTGRESQMKLREQHTTGENQSRGPQQMHLGEANHLGTEASLIKKREHEAAAV